MGRLVEGAWHTGDLGADARGRFVRLASQFRERITADGSSGFSPTPGRYVLYISAACPWCHRVLIALALRGLRDVFELVRVEPLMGDEGWTLAAGADPVRGARRLYDVYLAARPDYTGRVLVPALWDRDRATLVNNESLDLLRMLDEAYASDRPRLFPPERADEVAAMIQANYESVNNGVYKAGFAGSQQAHDDAVDALFARLDALEALLAERRYLLGDALTAADVCLFPTLFRFDAIYNLHFKCSVRQLRDYPHLWGYARDLYQTPGVAQTCELALCREHYFTSHESVNPRRLVPRGPTPAFDAPHDRARLVGAAR